jgi:DNA-binding PadR family transcriptional regulator
MTTGRAHQTACLVLAALAGGSQPGTGIIAEVAHISGGRVRLRVGALYLTLDRLRADGLVGVDREEISGRAVRRYYRLSRPGAARLAADAGTARVPVRAAHARLPARTGTARLPAAAGRPDLRVGDADRDAVAAALGEHFALGRLTAAELSARLDTALTATTQGELARAIWDLPSRRPFPGS